MLMTVIHKRVKTDDVGEGRLVKAFSYRHKYDSDFRYQHRMPLWYQVGR